MAPACLKVPDVDFVMPLKAVGMLTRAVVESIERHYAPRFIYIVSEKSECDKIQALSVDWDIPTDKFRFVDEEAFFVRAFGMWKKDFIPHYACPGDPDKAREFGWWWQQLIKLGAGFCIPEVSDNFYVWDSDIVVLKPWPLRFQDANPIYHIAILQEAARSAFNRDEYRASVMQLLGMETAYPKDGGTFVAHHMAMNKDILQKLVNHMDHRLPGEEPWPVKVLQTSKQRYRMSEYMLYTTFVEAMQSSGKEFVPFAHHPYEAYGDKGVRMREPEAFLRDLAQAHGLPKGGYSYESLQNYCRQGKTVGGDTYSEDLTVLQAEHVYGMSDLPQ